MKGQEGARIIRELSRSRDPGTRETREKAAQKVAKQKHKATMCEKQKCVPCKALEIKGKKKRRASLQGKLHGWGKGGGRWWQAEGKEDKGRKEMVGGIRQARWQAWL